MKTEFAQQDFDKCGIQAKLSWKKSENELKNTKTSNERAGKRAIGQSKTPKTPKIEQVLRERISGLEKQIEDLKQDKESHRRREGELLNLLKQQQTLLLPDKTNQQPSQKVGFFW